MNPTISVEKICRVFKHYDRGLISGFPFSPVWKGLMISYYYSDRPNPVRCVRDKKKVYKSANKYQDQAKIDKIKQMKSSYFLRLPKLLKSLLLFTNQFCGNRA